MAGKEKGKLHIHINLGTLVFLVIVVYLMAYMLTYIGKDKLAIYEVSASDIVDNIEGTGVILRQENLVNAAQDGYIKVSSRIGDGSQFSLFFLKEEISQN